jgi:hypothetical protein
LVLAHHREQYFDALARADTGNVAPFVDFIARVARDALAMITEALLTAKAPQPEKLLTEFGSLFLAQGEMTHKQLDSLAADVAVELLNLMSEQVDGLSVPDGVNVRVSSRKTAPRSHAPSGYRVAIDPVSPAVRVQFNSASPAEAAVQLNLEIFVSKDSDPAETIVVRSSGPVEEQLMLGLADLSPTLSSTARLRVENFLRRLTGQALNSLLAAARERLRRAGY